MRAWLTLGLFVAILSLPLRTAAALPLTCQDWRGLDESLRTLYVAGFLDGAAAGAVATAREALPPEATEARAAYARRRAPLSAAILGEVAAEAAADSLAEAGLASLWPPEGGRVAWLIYELTLVCAETTTPADVTLAEAFRLASQRLGALTRGQPEPLAPPSSPRLSEPSTEPERQRRLERVQRDRERIRAEAARERSGPAPAPARQMAPPPRGLEF